MMQRLLLAYGIAALMLTIGFGTMAYLQMPVQAAPPSNPDIVPCEAINTAETANGIIEIFYCEPMYGAPYKINSLGFMLNED